MSLRLQPLPALLTGATLIGLAPIFVRLADVGPTAAAFWRLALAAPLFALLMLLRGEGLGVPSLAGQRSAEQAPARPSMAGRSAGRMSTGHSPSPPHPPQLGWLALAGLFFAADLAVWHQAIHWTSVANSTLLTNLAPLWVTLAAWALWRERVRGGFLLGLALALGGALLLMADSLRVSRQTVIGDLLSVVTSLFYAGYLLLLSRQRRLHSTLAVMFWTTSAAALALLPLALASTDPLLPQSLSGWAVLLGLAWLSHAGGQGLIAYGFAHLPASFSAVSLLVQPLAAALFAWMILAEPFGLQQALGGAVVLGGIMVCRRAMQRG